MTVMDSVHLDESLLIGTGLHRKCYHHPDYADRCIKVQIDNSPRSVAETERELAYYRILDANNYSDMTGIIPRYYGAVETEQGTGQVFELVLNNDGTVAKPMSAYLKTPELREHYSAKMRAAYREFKIQAKRGPLVTMAMKPYNMLCQEIENGELRLVVIDNLGTANLIPAVYFSRLMAKLKLRRHLKRFEFLVRERHSFDLT